MTGEGRYPEPVPEGSLDDGGVPRFRCTACGNLTRFDVTVTRRSRAFYHYTVGGELSVEDEDVLAQQVEEVSCRWCGHGRAVQELRESEV